MSGFGVAVGTVIAGDYEIVRPLESGGMGSVFVARQRSLGVLRALKLMNVGLERDPSLRERFAREARLGAAIPSDHVVQVLHAGIDPDLDLPWIAMELLEGSTLSDHVARRAPLPASEIALVWSQFCAAIVTAHRMGIVHRDIKPENVFLARSRTVGMPFVVKVLDFGIAKLATGNRSNTILAGSPLFMAPEQSSRKGEISPRTDVWAMGLLAFYLFTGKHFWLAAEDPSAGPGDILAESVTEPIPAASERARHYGRAECLPAGFDAWFARATVRPPEERFADAEDAAHALARVIDGGDAGPWASALLPPSVPRGVAGHGEGSRMSRDGTRRIDEPAAEGGRAPTELGVPRGEGPRGTGAGQTDPQHTGVPLTVTGPRAGLQVAAAPRADGKGALVVVVAVAGFGAAAAGAYFATRSGASTPAPPAPSSASSVVSTTSLATARAEVADAGADPMAGMVELRPSAAPVFALDATEVTVAAYRACVAAGACNEAATRLVWEGASDDEVQAWSLLCNASVEDRDDHPINCVTWDQARQYCASLGRRLPTAAEWDHAAFGDGSRPFPWGAEPLVKTRANVCDDTCVGFAKAHHVTWRPLVDGQDGYSGTAPVRAFPSGASPDGVHDLAGNVSEWTSTAACDLPGADAGCDAFVVRGSGCQTARDDVLAHDGDLSKPHDFVSANIGFRCALTR